MDAIHLNMPEDAVEISKQLYAELFTVTLNGTVGVGADGLPALIPLPGPTHEDLSSRERAWRDAELQTSDGVVARHRDQLDVGSQTTLTDTQYGALQEYRARLRDWPAQKDFPDQSHRPVAPS